MNLSKVYFYIIIIIYLLFSCAIIGFTEDLKDNRHFKRYLKFTIPIGFLGIIMKLLNWNYLCNWNLILMTFSPFLTVLISKAIIEFYRSFLKKEGFQVLWGELSNGIWKKNKGNVENGFFYFWYTTNLSSLPVIVIGTLYFLIEKNIC